MKGLLKTYLIPSVAFLSANTYVIASWGCWSYGGSFSHRGFVESLGLFAIALGSFYASLRSKSAKIAVGALSSLLIIYSVIGMFGYWIRIVPFDESTSATILGLFTSTSMAGAAVAFLLTLPFWLLPILGATSDPSAKTPKSAARAV